MHSPRLKDIRSLGLRVWLGWLFGSNMWGLINLLVFRQRVTADVPIPRDEPFLLLGNHTSTLDPFWSGYAIKRPAGFMATAHVFRFRFLGPMLAAFGAFPKVKFVKDRESMATLTRIYEGGRPVTLFPEGTRSWDGRTLPVLPGIGRLIHRIGARVVFVRILSGHLWWPRWARYPRLVPIELEFSAPRMWSPEASPEEILADVQAAITIDPEREPQGFAWGFRTAWGLPDYLFACPRCMAWQGLQVAPDSHNHVQCGSCGGRWRVSPKGWLEAEHPDGDRTSVASAFSHIADQLGPLPRAIQPGYDDDGAILRGQDVKVGRVERGVKEPTPLARGELALLPEALELRASGGEVVWTLPLADIVAVSVELLGVLQVRTADLLFQLEPPHESTFTWSWFLRPWCEAAQEEPGDRR